MSRDILEKMTKDELIELASRQEKAIISLDMQRYDANAIIEHLASAVHDIHNLRYHDFDREHDQNYVDDFVSDMYAKYPTYIVLEEKNEEGEVETVEAEREEHLWIPVTERLPEEEGDYLVTKIDDENVPIIGFAYYNEFGWASKKTVTAWMPLPNPYEGAEE
jgi:hypothetical protein